MQNSLFSLLSNCLKVKMSESFLSMASAAFARNRFIRHSTLMGLSQSVESIQSDSSSDDSVLAPVESISSVGPSKPETIEIIDSDDEKSTGDERINRRARSILESIDAINTSLSEGSSSDDEVIVPATPDRETPLTALDSHSPLLDLSEPYYDEPAPATPPFRRTETAADLMSTPELAGFTFPDRALTLNETVSLYEAIVKGYLPVRGIRNLHRHQVMQFSLRWMKKYHVYFCLFWTPDGADHGYIRLNREYTTVFDDMVEKAKAKVGFGRTFTREQTRRFNQKKRKENAKIRQHFAPAKYYEDGDSDDE